MLCIYKYNFPSTQEKAGMTYVQASDGKAAVVVHSTHSQTSGLSFDQLCRSAKQCNCYSQADVDNAVADHMGQFQEPNGYGVVMLLMSVLASRTVRYASVVEL